MNKNLLPPQWPIITQKRAFIGSLIFFPVFFLVVIIINGFDFDTSNEHDIYAIFLLAIPIVIFFLSIWSLRVYSSSTQFGFNYSSVLVWALAINVILLSFLIWVYKNPGEQEATSIWWIVSNQFPILCLVFAALPFGMAIIAVMSRDPAHPSTFLSVVSSAVKQHWLTATATAFALFLFLTYFLAFALVFADRNPNDPALRVTFDQNCSVEQQSSVEEREKESSFFPNLDSSVAFLLGAEDALAQPSQPSTPSDREPLKMELYFLDADTDLKLISSSGSRKIDDVQDMRCRNRSQWLALRMQNTPVIMSAGKQQKEQIKIRNSIAVCEMIDYVKTLRKDDRRTLVRLTALPTRNDPNNLEYAKARNDEVENVFFDFNNSFGLHRPTGQPYLDFYRIRARKSDFDSVAVTQVEVMPHSIQERSERVMGDLRSQLYEQGSTLESILGYQLLNRLAAQQSADQQGQQQAQLDQVNGQLAALLPSLQSATQALSNTSKHLTDDTLQGDDSNRQPCRPQLLDYLYFLICTTMTTGYGDLQPVSPFAKLTVSLANLAEVFFIVIFFNIVVGGLRNGH